MSCPGRALPEGMRPAEAAMLRRKNPPQNAPDPRGKTPPPESPLPQKRPDRENSGSPPLLREKRSPFCRKTRSHAPALPGHALPPAPCSSGEHGRPARKTPENTAPDLPARYDKGGGKPPPFFSGGMPLRAFRLQRHRIIRTPGPWRTRSGRCCGGCRRHFPKADSRRQSADRPWGNASALRGLRSCRSCRTHWSTASCRR